MSDGKLEKLQIRAYSDPAFENQVGAPLQVMMNPENYSREIKM